MPVFLALLISGMGLQKGGGGQDRGSLTVPPPSLFTASQSKTAAFTNLKARHPDRITVQTGAAEGVDGFPVVKIALTIGKGDLKKKARLQPPPAASISGPQGLVIP